MANINKSLKYAVCIHQCDAIHRNENLQIVPGQLVQIFVNKSVNSQCCDIQIYNRENQCFGNELYQCDKKNFSEISPNVWSATNNLRNGSNVTLRLNLPSGNSNVKFCIDSFAECPTLGPGQFCKLNLIDNLIEDVKFEVDIKFYESNQSSHIIRLDKLIEALVLENSTTVNTELVEQSSSAITTCASSGRMQSRRIYRNAEDVYERNGRIQKNILVGQSAQFDRDTNAHSSNISSNREDENWEKADDLLKKIPETILWKIKNTLPDKESHHTLSALPLEPIQISHECDRTLTTTSHGIRPVHSTLNCSICRRECDIQVQLTCRHIICETCLFDVNLKDWQNSYCPFKNRNYSCSYKLTVNDIQNIASINENHVKQCVESNNMFPDEGGDYNGEELVFCKNENCDGGWFTDKSELIFIYACPKCGTYNCLKCEAIHQNMTCQEYNHFFNQKSDVKKLTDQQDGMNLYANQMNTASNNSSSDSTIRSKSEVSVTKSFKPNVIRGTRNVSLAFNDNDRNGEVLIYCNKDDCSGCWFVIMPSKSNVYQCPVCEIYNCLSCQVIHENMSCEQYQQLIPIRENIDNFYEDCLICGGTINTENDIQLHGCLHMFCRDCIIVYIEDGNQTEITCPFVSCNNILQDWQIRKILKGRELDATKDFHF